MREKDKEEEEEEDGQAFEEEEEEEDKDKSMEEKNGLEAWEGATCTSRMWRRSRDVG